MISNSDAQFPSCFSDREFGSESEDVGVSVNTRGYLDATSEKSAVRTEIHSEYSSTRDDALGFPRISYDFLWFSYV